MTPPGLSRYNSASLENSQRGYFCEECVDISEKLWKEDISLNQAGKRTNQEPNTSNEEIGNKRKYEVIIEDLRKELKETEKICKVKDRDIKLQQERKSELQNEKKKKQQLKQSKTVRRQNMQMRKT